MKKFTASMVSKGNHLFQASITILDNGVKLRIPNFWRNQETFFSFSDMSGVELTTPSWYTVLTYSTINFNLRGTWVEAHGFTKSDALTIKRLIDEGRSGGGNSSINEYGQDTSKFSHSKQQDWINYQHDRQVRLDREERIARENEQHKELIPKLKKLISEYWIDILSYGNNNDFNKLSEMVSPPSNENAIEELNDYIKKLKQITYDIYGEEYWEIEYKSIDKEIWAEINEELRYFLKSKFDENHVRAKKYILKLNKVWNKIDFSLLKNECIDYPRVTNLFFEVIFLTKRRKSLINKMKEKIAVEKEWTDCYRPELLTLLMIVDKLQDDLYYLENNEYEMPAHFYHLNSESIKSYLLDSSIILNKRMSKIIECTNDFIKEIAEY